MRFVTMKKGLIYVLMLGDMWYFVIKNGKAIKAYRSEQRALNYADAKVSFNPLRDVLRVVREDGEILKEF